VTSCYNLSTDRRDISYKLNEDDSFYHSESKNF